MKNELIPKKELNFFQKIRKYFFIRNFDDTNKYANAPDFLKNDLDVIGQFVKINPRNLNELPSELQEKFIIQADEETQLFFLKINTNLRDKMMKFLNKNLQFRILTETFVFKDIDGNNMKNFPKDYSSVLNIFDIEVLKKALKEILNSNNFEFDNNKIKKEEMTINNLPINLQIEIAKQDSNFIKKMSYEAIDMYVNNNPFIARSLPEEIRNEFVKNNPKYYKILLSEDNKINNYELQKEDNYLYYKQQMINYIGVQPWAVNGAYDFVLENCSPENFIELTKLFPTILYGISDKTKVFDLLKKQIKNDSILESFNNEQFKENSESFVELSKILLNEEVMKKCSPEQIKRIIDLENMKCSDLTFKNQINIKYMEALKDIVKTTYGEKAFQIMNARPGLISRNIHNLDIFNPSIIEKFGEGFIHNLLSYNNKAAGIVGELARNPIEMKKYDIFDELTKGLFENTMLDYEKKFRTFEYFNGMISNFNSETITENRKKQMQVVVLDFLKVLNSEYLDFVNNPLSVIPLNTPEDLDKYVGIRDLLYNEAIDSISNPEQIKELIFGRFFGTAYETTSKGEKDYSADNVCIKDMLGIYDLETFVVDERTENSDLFTNNELDILKLVTIVSQIKDSIVLKQIYSNLRNSSNILTPLDFKKIKDKIPEQYAVELKKTLLTIDNAKERANSGEEGISYEKTEDGYEIVNLKGAKFNILVHASYFINENSVSNLDFSSLKVHTADEIWKKFEQGCSSISAGYIGDNLMVPPMKSANFQLGFANFSAKQLLGMNYMDANITHQERRINPVFEEKEVRYNYPEELERKTLTLNGKWPNNEVAILRRFIDIDDSNNENNAGRIMPDYIISYGEVTQFHKELATKFGKEGKPLPIIAIDKELYAKRTENYKKILADEKIREEEKNLNGEKQKEQIKKINEDVKKILKNDDIEIDF